MREKEDEDEVVADWKFAAMVIDRFVVFDSVKLSSVVMVIDRFSSLILER
jgi:hypothetical protein